MAQAFGAILEDLRKARRGRAQTTDEFYLQPVAFASRTHVDLCVRGVLKNPAQGLLDDLIETTLERMRRILRQIAKLATHDARRVRLVQTDCRTDHFGKRQFLQIRWGQSRRNPPYPLHALLQRRIDGRNFFADLVWGLPQGVEPQLCEGDE